MPSKGKVEINIHGATELKDTQTLGRQDPYCVITPVDTSGNLLTDERLQTSVDEDGGKKPVWNQIAVVNLTDSHQLWVRIDVWNKNNINEDSYIGRVRVPLQAAVSNGVDKLQLPVFRPSGKQKGWMKVSLRFLPEASQNVQGLDLAGVPQASRKSNGVVMGNPRSPGNAPSNGLEFRVDNQTATPFSAPYDPGYGEKHEEHTSSHRHGYAGSYYRPHYYHRPYYYRPYYGYRGYGYGYPYYYRPYYGYGYRYHGLGYGLAGGLLLGSLL